MIKFTSSLLQGEGDRDTTSFPGEVRLHPVHHLGGPGGEERVSIHDLHLGVMRGPYYSIHTTNLIPALKLLLLVSVTHPLSPSDQILSLFGVFLSDHFFVR